MKEKPTYLKFTLAFGGACIAAFVALLDQLSKYWVLEIMDPPHVETLLPCLNIVLSWNKGVTFGFFNDAGAMGPIILGCLALAILGYLFWWLAHATTRWTCVGLGFVIGGAIGNLVDRIRFGAVVDFIDFHVFGYHWYTFNVADSAILCGVVLLLAEHLFLGHKKA